MPSAQGTNNVQAAPSAAVRATTPWDFVEVIDAQGDEKYQIVVLHAPRSFEEERLKIDTATTGAVACPLSWKVGYSTIQCRAHFKTKGLLRAHQKACHEYLPWLCRGCSMVFWDEANCRRHAKHKCAPAQRLGVPQKPKISCRYAGCPKTDTRADNMRRHEGRCSFGLRALPAAGLPTLATYDAVASASTTPSPDTTTLGAERRQTPSEEPTEEAPPSPRRQPTQPPAENGPPIPGLPSLGPLEKHFLWQAASFDYEVDLPEDWVIDPPRDLVIDPRLLSLDLRR